MPTTYCEVGDEFVAARDRFDQFIAAEERRIAQRKNRRLDEECDGVGDPLPGIVLGCCVGGCLWCAIVGAVKKFVL